MKQTIYKKGRENKQKRVKSKVAKRECWNSKYVLGKKQQLI